MFCCARYSADQAWYRALVTSVDLTNQTAAVLFVDHGNTDAVNISTDLRRLTADLTRSPCQAVACSLGRGAWSAEQCSSFEVAAMDKPLQATFKEYLDNVWLVSLKDGSVSLDQLLLSSREETPCIKEPCLSSEDEPSVYIVSVNSAADVRLQLSRHVNDLEALMSDIADNPPQGNLPTAEHECGMYCLARFTEDEAWYRAKVRFSCLRDWFSKKYSLMFICLLSFRCWNVMETRRRFFMLTTETRNGLLLIIFQFTRSLFPLLFGPFIGSWYLD
jgi:hypothetical protein